MAVHKILIDCREFASGHETGISRVLRGLIAALSQRRNIHQIYLAVSSAKFSLDLLTDEEKIRKIPVSASFFLSELSLSRRSRGGVALLISPYPKLPLFGCGCRAVHIVHDVLDLTFPPYRKRFKAVFDVLRLKSALRNADLTWYDSRWSLEECRKLTGQAGRNPKVRYPGIDGRFNVPADDRPDDTLRRYDLQPGYVLVLGNGMPHKNPGILLEISGKLSRPIVFAGVSPARQAYWKRKYPAAQARWIEHVREQDLPLLIGKAFCLAQPSLIEGYGYPPLEAMACGVPALIGRIPVLLETTGGNALCADPHEPRDWLAHIQKLEDPIVHREQAAKGLAWVQGLRGPNGWSRHVRDIEELLNEV